MLVNALPVIETWSNPIDPIGYVVGFSSAGTMKLLVDHLAQQGCKRIAFMGGNSESDKREKVRQCDLQKVMASHDMKANRLVG